MNDYIEQAEQFLNNHDATIDMEYKEGVYSPWGDKMFHDVYTVTIERKNHEPWTFDFTASAHDTENGIEPTAYDVLACLEKDEITTYADFCLDFGYPGGEDSLELYHKVKEEYENVMRMFGDCMEELWEIS